MNVDRDAIVDVFRAESVEALSRVEAHLMGLERDPRNRELVQEVFRCMHTLKGDALSLGFVWLSEFAHELENILDAVREQQLSVTPALTNLLLRAVDALRAIVPEALEGSTHARDEHTALLAELGRLLRSAPEAPDAELEPAPEQREEAEPQPDRARTLRVDVGKLDRMLALNGEIAITRSRTRQLLEEQGQHLPKDLLELHLEADRLFLDLQELVLRARMVPISPVFAQHERTVRDTASSLYKSARLEVRAEGVELDTAVVERIRAPLLHMIRNAIDHGIEPPARRAVRGKDPCGTIALEARHDGSSIVIEVRDDGAGLDRAKIAERARLLGLADNPERLPDRALFELIFTPGFSTAAAVTEVSGRGLGMDIVRRSIDALRGTVWIESREGVGTTFRIRLPLTLAIIEGLVVGVADERYVIPLSSVIECVDFDGVSCDESEARGLARVREEALPFLRLGKLFGISAAKPARENLVIVRHGASKLGLTVDTLVGDAQTMVKPLGRLFQDVPGVAGSAILGSGRVALILDVPSLLRGVAEGTIFASANKQPSSASRKEMRHTS